MKQLYRTEAQTPTTDWVRNRIKPDQIERYMDNGRCFIDAGQIERHLRQINEPDAGRLREILAKSLDTQTLSPEETAMLLQIEDEQMLAEMEETAAKVKKKVYDNRIVTFAPLYLNNQCVNNCLYCGFRNDNKNAARKQLSLDEVRREVEVLAGKIGHKRLIVVYGEHPESNVDYMVETLREISSVKVKARKGYGQIRRCNVNAAPMQIEELTRLAEAGIGTYQVFQETYHPDFYRKVHPPATLKGDYLWRLYSMHRAMEAGIDDVGLGALFGLYDWKFEVMGLLYHSIELEQKFGVGPHTISFPRLEPATNTPFTEKPEYKVSDEDIRRIVTVLRLAVPHTGLILTARENAHIRRELLPLGVTQTDASTRIGIGGYTEADEKQDGPKQQFILGDTRSLDDLVGELAQAGYITSFCTAGYRCGRTGKCIMDLLRSGQEGKFCKLNAAITFREWLDDFASEQTRSVGEKVLAAEIQEIKQDMPNVYARFMEIYKKTAAGQRDLYF